MDIKISEFSSEQQQALFDLLVLAMYADGHLSSVEDERLDGLLKAMGYLTESDRDLAFDDAVTRIRTSIENIQIAKDRAIQIARQFTTRSQHKQVYQAVQEIMTSDQHVSTWESTLLSELRLKFRL